MEKNYDPHAVEARWGERWLKSGVFHGTPSRGGEPYCIVIPPPNVTGILHMGHALNNTIQDVLARWRRMQGRNVVWMPGTDHAGIATQNVVERALRKEGKTRHDLARDAFVERVWQWKEEYGGTIIRQLKRLGCSCDWERERFTMDAGLSRAVTEVFVRLYDKGLIRRGNYIINWCPRCHTALSDEESEHVDHDGKLYYIRYPLYGQAGHVVVATTRPETLLGDVAVAVNPKDERYRPLLDQMLRLPVLDRVIPFIRDELVDPAFGTGAVKVTPAHDPNDFEMGNRHGLTPINVMNGDGTMNEAAGPYAGLDRFECRKRIVADLEAAGLIEKIDTHKHAVGHCYRCDTVVEPRLSLQWFVRMKPLAAPALQAVRDGRIRFVPERWNKVYIEWMENIRDWCISRQIWWGHRIPVFYCDRCGHEWAAGEKPAACPACGDVQIRQDEDVLDTWFSSWLWPFSTFGWPEQTSDLRFYYPTRDLVTASEIIFFWVARMIMAGMEFMGDIPFDTVYIHGTVRDNQGRKMSKSLGNAIDPLAIIDKFSADALRFSLLMITATGQDVYLADDKFEVGRNFGTKIWNAARFIRLHADKHPDLARQVAGWATAPAFDAARLTSDDRHLLTRLQETIAACNDNLERYRFNDVAKALYEFLWHQLCDWYVEYAKDTLYGEDAGAQRHALTLMHYALSTTLRLLHPLMPYLTEELWHAMDYGDADSFIMQAAWPAVAPAAVQASWGIVPDEVQYVDDKHELIRAGRTLRADYGVLPAKHVRFIVRPGTAEAAGRLERDRASLMSLLRCDNLVIDPALAEDTVMPGAVSRLGAIFMPLAGVVDVAAERERLGAQLEKAQQALRGVAAKLNNESFVTRAKPDVVQHQRDRQTALLEEIAKYEQLLANLR